MPEDIPRGVYRASNVPGAWPGCIWTTYTSDGTLIDAFNQSLTEGAFEIDLLSPAIATFDSSEGCTPLIKIQP